MRMRRPGGLWLHPDFLNLSAETVSQFGSQITGLALPLVAIVTLEASAFEVALLGVSSSRRSSSSPPGRRLGRPAAAQADPRHRWTSAAPRCWPDPGRVRLRRADDLAALRRRLPLRGPDGLLRRLVPVVSPVARRTRAARRGQLEARDQPLGRAARRAGLAGVLIQASRPAAMLLDAISFVFLGTFLFPIRKPEERPDASRAGAAAA